MMIFYVCKEGTGMVESSYETIYKMKKMLKTITNNVHWDKIGPWMTLDEVSKRNLNMNWMRV